MSPIQKILVPVDFSPHASKAFDFAIDLARQFGAKIEILHCYQINPGGISPYGIVFPENLDREFRDAALAKLDAWSDRAKSADIEAGVSLVPDLPSEAIARAAKEKTCDLIVMGTRGLTGLRHVVLGSVAERTIRIAHCPVLTVKDDSSDA
jgi:nucleotide-binding universal stress UspA family protein